MACLSSPTEVPRRTGYINFKYKNMNQINREERTWSVLVRLVVICAIALGINFMLS